MHLHHVLTLSMSMLLSMMTMNNFVDIKSVSIESEPIDELPNPAFVFFTHDTLYQKSFNILTASPHEKLYNVPGITAAEGLNFMALTCGPTVADAPNRSCRHDGSLHCNEKNLLRKLLVAKQLF